MTAAPAEPTRTRRASGTYSIALLVAVVLLQRFVIPAGGTQQIALTLPVGIVILLLGIRAGEFVPRRAQLHCALVIVATAVLCTLVHVVTGGAPSLLSLGLVVILYAAAAFSADLGPVAVARVQRVFLRLMSVAAVVSLLQLGVQYAGVAHQDWLGTVVPKALLQAGYNTGDPITYGADLYRSNGVLFLEPSFLSLFLGVAVAVALHSGAGWKRLTLLLLGIVPTLAGGGLVVIIPAVIAVALGRHRRKLLGLLPAAVAAVVAAAVTPFGTQYLARSTEASNPNTSSSYRLVQPYSSLMPPSMDTTVHALIGHGAGAADRYLLAVDRADVTVPLVPKVLFEYGLLGLVGILLPLVLLLVGGLRFRPWAAGVVLAYLYVNASFIQSTLVFLTLFWVTLLPPRDGRAVGRNEADGQDAPARGSADRGGAATPVAPRKELAGAVGGGRGPGR